jgi:hypothetical protein
MVRHTSRTQWHHCLRPHVLHLINNTTQPAIAPIIAHVTDNAANSTMHAPRPRCANACRLCAQEEPAFLSIGSMRVYATPTGSSRRRRGRQRSKQGEADKASSGSGSDGDSDDDEHLQDYLDNINNSDNNSEEVRGAAIHPLAGLLAGSCPAPAPCPLCLPRTSAFHRFPEQPRRCTIAYRRTSHTAAQPPVFLQSVPQVSCTHRTQPRPSSIPARTRAAAALGRPVHRSAGLR